MMTGDDRPPPGEPQDDMAVTDRQWTYQVVAHWTPGEAQRLVAMSRQAAVLAQSPPPEGGSDAEDGE